jgi:hypothetical protein
MPGLPAAARTCDRTTPRKIFPKTMFNEVYTCVPVEEVLGLDFNYSGRIFLPQFSLLLILNQYNNGETEKASYSRIKPFLKNLK